MRQYSTAPFSVLMTVLACHNSFGQQPEGMKQELDAIVKAQTASHRQFLKDFQIKTTEEEQKQSIDRYQAEVARNTGKVLDMVRRNPTDPNVVQALKFVIETSGRGPGNESYQAMDILLRDHVRDPGMGEVCGRTFHFWHSPVAESLLRNVLKRHPDRLDRGLACYTLSYTLGLRASMVRSFRSGLDKIEGHIEEPFQKATECLVKEADPGALEHERERLLERVIAEFPDVKDWFNPKRKIGAIAEGELFAIRNLAEGKVAPEIRGRDHEGKAFALSDYRGKVVVLTFSASWCGPCVGMYPQERELVKKLEGKPFALVSVSADEDLETLQKSIALGEITWRCWWDGGTDGPITTRWGVSAFPEIYVLDQAGVIRVKNVRDDHLKKAVASLLDETPASRGLPK
jgi:thiol-disulfide isomerase/thioredoxin